MPPVSPPVNEATTERQRANAIVPSIYINHLLVSLGVRGNAAAVRQNDCDTTAAQLLELTFRYARALEDVGVKRGDVIALVAPNCVEALAVRYAASLLGAASSYLAVPGTVAHLGELIVQIDPTLLIVFPETAQLLPFDMTVPMVTIGDCVVAGSRQLDRIAATASGERMPGKGQPADLGILVCSGGSTGVPKASWRSFAAYTAMLRAPTRADRRQLINGPLAYLSQVLVDITLIGGGTVVLDRGFDAARTLALIEEERITDLFLVEPQLFELMDLPDVARRDLTSLRTLTHVGGSAPPVLRRRARARLGDVIVHNYGASEMGIVSSLPAAPHDIAEADLFGSAGRVLPEVDVRLRGCDGALASAGAVGVIEVRSPAQSGGYRNRPELQSAFQDGWYHSGDLGFLDEGGYLHVLGRGDDAAWIDGTLVTPLLIEETLCGLPAVRYAVVIRDSVGSWVAAVEPWPGLSIDQCACRAAVAAAHGSISVAIVMVERVPRTEQGKADRVAISRLALKRTNTIHLETRRPALQPFSVGPR